MPFNILGHPILDKIKKLQEQTNINMNDIPLNNPEIFNVFKNAQTDNFLAFSKPLTKDLLKKRKPSTFKELINILGIVFDEGNFSQKILFKEDLYHYFIQKKIPKNMAYKITKFISNGYQKDNQDVWKQYQKTLKDYHIDDQFIEQCQNIKYLVSKAHCLSYLIFDVQLAWYKINFPKIFQKIMSE